jgi:hypothetical protein
MPIRGFVDRVTTGVWFLIDDQQTTYRQDWEFNHNEVSVNMFRIAFQKVQQGYSTIFSRVLGVWVGLAENLPNRVKNALARANYQEFGLGSKTYQIGNVLIMCESRQIVINNDLQNTLIDLLYLHG